MYFVIVILFMLVCPATWVLAASAASHHTVSIYFLIAKWYVFWAVGVRLFTAGIRQVLQPRFTSNVIFGIQGSETQAIVREVGAIWPLWR